MAEGYWTSLMRDYVDGFTAIVDDAKGQALEKFFELTENEDRGTRKVFYQGVDWERVRTLAPDLYPRMSADALAIADAERKAEIKKLQEFEHEMYIQAAAFRPQVAPFGYLPMSPTSADLGLGLPLPMTSYGQ